jgi:hypothetical protein
MVLNIPSASEKKLSVSQKAIVEKFLVNVMYSPDDEVKNAMACVPQMGAKIRVVKAEELDGKKIVAKVDGPECVNEATGVLHSDEFEDLAKEFGAVVKAF